MIPTDDRGLLLGDGLFETVLAVDGRLDAFEAHAERLVEGCGVLGLPPPDRGALEDAAASALASAGLRSARAAVRLTWTAGSGGRGIERMDRPRPRLIAAAFPAPEPGGACTLATAAVRRNDASPAARLKTLSYLDNVLARREARAAGADEALMLNTRGELACAAVANLFWFEGERLVTPALDCGVLAGVTRARVLARARGLGLDVLETRRPREALDAARGLFVTNSLIGVRTVSALDGRPVESHPALADLSSSW